MWSLDIRFLGGGLLFFELSGEVFPFGGEGGVLVAEDVQLGGEGLGGFGGGEDGLLLLGGEDAVFEDGEFGFEGGDAVFELFELDGV